MVNLQSWNWHFLASTDKSWINFPFRLHCKALWAFNIITSADRITWGTNHFRQTFHESFGNQFIIQQHLLPQPLRICCFSLFLRSYIKCLLVWQKLIWRKNISSKGVWRHHLGVNKRFVNYKIKGWIRSGVLSKYLPYKDHQPCTKTILIDVCGSYRRKKKRLPARCEEKAHLKASAFLTHCIPLRMLNGTELRAVVLQPTSSKHEHETAFGRLGLNSLIHQCKPQGSQTQSPEVKDATHTTANMSFWRCISYCGLKNHDMEHFTLTSEQRRSRNTNHLHYRVSHSMKSANVELHLWADTFLHSMAEWFIL